MNRIKRNCSFLLVLLLVCQVSALPIYAAGKNDYAMSEKSPKQNEMKEAKRKNTIESGLSMEDILDDNISSEENVPDEQTEENSQDADDGKEDPDNESEQELSPESTVPEDETGADNEEDPTEEAVIPISPDEKMELETEAAKELQADDIIWVEGITPPELSDFEAEIVFGRNSIQYITYKAPYQPGNGWYDINKEFKGQDASLCFAVAASNALHWWMDQNVDHIDEYIEQKPLDEKRQEVQRIREFPVSQTESEIYRRFVKQFSGKPDGYWSDILVDQFINGYKPKENGGTNSETDRENLLENGPIQNGGYFYDVFGTIRLSERRSYYAAYKALSNDLKKILMDGNLVLLDYQIGNIGHVVTLWGAEYDSNDQLSAVYITDSDDTDSPYAMVRYNVINKNGYPILSTDVNGIHGSKIGGIQIISQGKEIWSKRLNEDPDAPKIPLNLQWEDSEFTYNGQIQYPFVEAFGIEEGDDVGILVDTWQRGLNKYKDAGEYTAKAVIRGASADRYELAENPVKQFTIKKARPTVTLSADTQSDEANGAVVFHIDVRGVNGEKPDGTVQLRTAYEILESDIQVVNGKAAYICTNLPSGIHRVTASFSPSKEGAGKNYTERSSKSVLVDISDKKEQSIRIVPVEGKKFGDGSFELRVEGGAGVGAVVYSCSTDDVLSIKGNTATIVGAGTTTITAVKEADLEYNSATADYVITIEKAPAPTITYPTASSLVYGQKLSDSVLSGGSDQYGNFAWDNGAMIPNAGSTGYLVRFTPSTETEKNYEDISVKTEMVDVFVNKITPYMTIKAEVADQGNLRNIVLSASIVKVPNGNDATGTVDFINCTDAHNTEVVSSVTVADGAATYTWAVTPNQSYKIKAVYGGDTNYNPVSSQEIHVDVGGDSGGAGDQENNGGNNGEVEDQENNGGNNGGVEDQENNSGNNGGAEDQENNGQDNGGVEDQENNGQDSGGVGNQENNGQDNGGVGNQENNGQDNGGVEGQENNSGNSGGAEDQENGSYTKPENHERDNELEPVMKAHNNKKEISKEESANVKGNTAPKNDVRNSQNSSAGYREDEIGNGNTEDSSKDHTDVSVVYQEEQEETQMTNDKGKGAVKKVLTGILLVSIVFTFSAAVVLQFRKKK